MDAQQQGEKIAKPAREATGWQYWSDEFYRILGYAPQAFPADQDVFLKRVHTDDLPRLRPPPGYVNPLRASSVLGVAEAWG